MKTGLESPPKGIAIVSGPALDIGPSKKVEIERRNLLVELGVDKTPERTKYEVVLLVVVELLVLLAFALSISFYLLARKTDPEEKPDDLTQSLHILAVVTNILLLPHLLVLALHRDGWLNQILRLCLCLVVLIISITSLALSDRQLKPMAVALNIFTFIFLATTVLRVMFKTRLKKFIVRIRFIGAILEEVSRKGSQTLQLLIILIILIGTIKNMNEEVFLNYYEVRHLKHTVSQRAALIVLDAVANVFNMGWVMLFVFTYSKVHFRKTRKRRVQKDILEEKLKVLAESNRETLLNDTHISLARYRPLTRDSNIPVISSSRREGEVVSSKSKFWKKK